MNIDYRLLWLFAMLFVPFCSNRASDAESNNLVCSSINSPELTKKVASLRRTLDSAIVKAETQKQAQQVPAKKLYIISGLESIRNYGRENPPE